jgi:hypothetical protein
MSADLHAAMSLRLPWNRSLQGSRGDPLGTATQFVRTLAARDQVIADFDDFWRDRIWFRLWSRCGLPAPYAGLHDRAKRG